MKVLSIAVILVAAVWLGCRAVSGTDRKMEGSMAQGETKTAVFAGGCFWCTESDFEKVEGVVEVISGYTGGDVENPSYKQVSAGGTGHVEAIRVVYDPARVSYAQLLDVFWRHVDPTDPGGQFVDRGDQYRSMIFYTDEEQKRLAEASKKALQDSGRFGKPIVTEIRKLGLFYPAEEYHQDYYRENPIRYRYYRSSSGRDQFLERAWGGDEEPMAKGDKMKSDNPMGMGTDKLEKSGEASGMGFSMTGYVRPDDETLRKSLSPMQYRVAREEGTEPPFQNEYWDNHEPGIYVDVVSGEPLFSSTDKFDSGTGWPSFTRPLEPENIVEKSDRSLFTVRTEVRSKHADSHLGHMFDDGPAPTGLRYCINSASLQFVPKDALEKEGYGKYRKLFQ